VTPEVVLGFPVTLVLVTLNVTVQLLLAGMVIPVKLRLVAPALSVLGVCPSASTADPHRLLRSYW